MVRSLLINTDDDQVTCIICILYLLYSFMVGTGYKLGKCITSSCCASVNNYFLTALPLHSDQHQLLLSDCGLFDLKSHPSSLVLSESATSLSKEGLELANLNSLII